MAVIHEGRGRRGEEDRRKGEKRIGKEEGRKRERGEKRNKK